MAPRRPPKGRSSRSAPSPVRCSARIVGGTAGSVIAQGSQFGLGAYFLKYGREYETQADILGAQMLARAGYDPREMANMFKTIEAEGGGGGPEWLSSHPNPGNRFNAINREAQSLRVQGNANTGQFATIKQRLGGMSAGVHRRADCQGAGVEPAGGHRLAAPPCRVPAPSTQYRQYQPGNFLRLQVPANWSEIAAERRRHLCPGRRLRPQPEWPHRLSRMVCRSV